MTTPMAAATVTAGAATATGFGLFGYNRENYMYDAEFRYERFSAGREFAIEQMDMYREDLRKLSELTAKKCGLYSIFASLGMALCVALYCAGRLGLHGPSPPMHVMGLWLTCNAAAFAYYVVAIWLSVHACYRASAATTQLLTRRARVPVPSLKQLDKARRFGSEFEQQDWADIFRIPYLNGPGVAVRENDARASSEPPQRRENKESSWVRDEFNTNQAGTVSGPSKSNNAPFMARAPEHFELYTDVQKHWIQYDVYARVSLLYGYISFVHSLCYYGLGHINVELRAWWVAYATAFVIATLLVLLLKFDIVPNESDKNDWYSMTLWLGPAAVLPAAIAMSLDFRVEFNLTAIAFTWFFIFVSYIMQFIYTMRLLWILQPDQKGVDPDDGVGNSWLPANWKLPTRFQHVLYVVTPPQQLKPGLNDIVREIKEGIVEPAFIMKDEPDLAEMEKAVQHLDKAFEWFKNQSMTQDSEETVKRLDAEYTSKRAAWKTAKKRDHKELATCAQTCINALEAVTQAEGFLSGNGADVPDVDPSDGDMGGKRQAPPLFKQTKHIQPYLTVLSLTAVLLFSWLFLIIGNIVDCATGEQSTLTAPHWSRPPMTRMSYVPHDLGTPIGFPWPASARPYYPEQMRWHEEKRIPGMDTIFHASGFAHEGRRLQGGATAQAQGLREAVEDLMALLPGDGAEVALPAPEQISWPGLFEPRLLACGPPGQDGGGMVAAFTQRGFGAAARLGAASAAEPFRLAGLSHLPPLVGASWGVDGLTLVSRSGDLVACPGQRPKSGGSWTCGPAPGAPARLPVPEGTQLLAASAAVLSGPGGVGGEPRLHAALLHESTPDLVALFHLDGGAWLPLGEVAVPTHGADSAGAPGRVSLALSPGGDLTLATDTGAVVQRRLRDGAIIGSTPSGKKPRQAWRGACSVRHGSADRVAHLHLQKSALAQRPEVTLAEDFGSSQVGDELLYP